MENDFISCTFSYAYCINLMYTKKHEHNNITWQTILVIPNLHMWQCYKILFYVYRFSFFTSFYISLFRIIVKPIFDNNDAAFFLIVICYTVFAFTYMTIVGTPQICVHLSDTSDIYILTIACNEMEYLKLYGVKFWST